MTDFSDHASQLYLSTGQIRAFCIPSLSSRDFMLVMARVPQGGLVFRRAFVHRKISWSLQQFLKPRQR
jgi:hypothetical protein